MSAYFFNSQEESDIQSLQGEGPWGMPSSDVMTSTIVGIHAIEHVNIPLGVLIILGSSASQLLLG